MLLELFIPKDCKDTPICDNILYHILVSAVFKIWCRFKKSLVDCFRLVYWGWPILCILVLWSDDTHILVASNA